MCMTVSVCMSMGNDFLYVCVCEYGHLCMSVCVGVFVWVTDCVGVGVCGGV